MELIEIEGIEFFARMERKYFSRGERAEAAEAQDAIEGYATLYNAPIVHDSRVKVLMPGCFASSLAKRGAIKFQFDHNAANVVASTRDALELSDDETGLAFRLPLPHDYRGHAIQRMVDSRDRCGVSVAYTTVSDEVHEVAGQKVTFVTEAELHEISLVRKGAVALAFARLIDTTAEPPLRDSVRTDDFKAAHALHRLSAGLKNLKATLADVRPVTRPAPRLSAEEHQWLKVAAIRQGRA